MRDPERWAATAGIRIVANATARTGSPAFQRIDLRVIGAALVLVVHGCADAVAYETADRRTRDAGCDPRAGRATDLRADRATRQRSHQRTGIFARAGSRIRVTRAAGEAR